VRAAVQDLPEDLREALVLCEWEDMSAADAAAVLQTTSRAIESRLYRARRLLKDRLKRWL
jgi:RNA polymerase sigma-70 factor (ECF subfamily)